MLILSRAITKCQPLLAYLSEKTTYLDVYGRDITNHIIVVIHHSERRYPLIIHKLQSVKQRFISTIHEH
jgi:hypothetical protein